jgi:tetratricopeptide (TPR) repeat protein
MTRKTINWAAAILIIGILCGGGLFWLRRRAVKKPDLTAYHDIVEEHEPEIDFLQEEESGSLASLKPAWERLQMGIYYQETAGDLDRAIKIYRQIEAPRAASAQAQYRIGLCFEEKGQTSEARSTLEKLVREYPDEPEVVFLAKSLLASLEHGAGSTSAPGGRPPA